ncbi:MAG: sugar nucleotide-binding protein, partial [Acidobacteria bacterium]|nr:sugar nucleotide-binding protein [Acidobacteriota bacterium]
RSAAVEGSRLKKILPIPSSEYRTAATRPKNSRLDCSKLRRSFGIEMAHWEEELKALLHPEVAASAART